MNEEKIFYKDAVITISIITNGAETYYKLQDNLLNHDPVRHETLSGVLANSFISRKKMQEVIHYIFLKWTLFFKLWIGAVNSKIKMIGEIKDKRRLQKEINREIYKIVFHLGGEKDVLEIIENYCTTNSDKETLKSLKLHNAAHQPVL